MRTTIDLPVSVLREIKVFAAARGITVEQFILEVVQQAKTGRSPRDKRVVKHPHSEKNVWWGPVNIPMDRQVFEINRERAIDYLNTRDRLYCFDGFAGWDPKYRLADQDRDGVGAELIYPTVGMLLCNHKDFDFKKACFEAYNRWLAEYCSEAPNRIYGLAQVSMRTPEDGVAELKAVKEMGFKGVMMPGDPGVSRLVRCLTLPHPLLQSHRAFSTFI